MSIDTLRNLKTRPNDGTCDILKGECVIAGMIVSFKELETAAREVEELSAGLNLTTTRTRSWYEDTWTERVPDYGAIAVLVHRALKQPSTKEAAHGIGEADHG